MPTSLAVLFFIHYVKEPRDITNTSKPLTLIIIDKHWLKFNVKIVIIVTPLQHAVFVSIDLMLYYPREAGIERQTNFPYPEKQALTSTGCLAVATHLSFLSMVWEINVLRVVVLSISLLVSFTAKTGDPTTFRAVS